MKYLWTKVVFGILLATGAAMWSLRPAGRAVPQVVYLDPFAVSGRKVHLRGWSVPSVRGDALEFPVMQGSPSVEAGTRLAVLLDESCRNSVGFLGLKHDPSGARAPRLRSRAIRLARAMDLVALERLAQDDPCVRGVSYNLSFRADSMPVSPEGGDSDADPLVGSQTHLTALGTSETFDAFLDPTKGIRQEVTIAVIDTGIDVHHPELQDVLWTNEAERAGKEGQDDDGDGYVDDLHGWNFPDGTPDISHQIVNDHGTHVAGLIAATARNGIGGMGVMGRKARIMALNVFGRNWSADTVDIDNAIRYAADHGANVINISVGGPGYSDTTASALAYALGKGAVVVASAGNLRQDIDRDVASPASYASRFPGMLAVASLDARTGALCGDSSFGHASVKIAAPGCDQQAPKQGLLSTANGGRYAYRKGTSMAAPLVAGAAALAFGWLRDHRGAGASPSPAEVEAVLLEGARRSSVLADFVAEGRVLALPDLLRTLTSPEPRSRP